MRQICTYLLFLSILVSCGLKYEPVKTPIDKEKLRKEQIVSQLNDDFTKQGKSYKNYGFAPSTVLKPPSYFRLDSLYEVKYKLEQEGKIDKKLEEKIQLQKNIIYNDTNFIFYIENHVFSITEDSVFTMLNAEIYTDRTNKINTIEILESVNLDKKLGNFYAYYKLRQSFVSPEFEADEAELAFYDFYQQKAEKLEGTEKDEFIQFMLTVMKTANKISSLDKSLLIKEFVRYFVQGQSRNYLDEKFERMEEFYDDENKLVNYQIDYQYLSKQKEISEIKKVRIILDPYLQLIELKNL